jgi:hypothetical protein
METAMRKLGRRTFRAGRHADAWFAERCGAWRQRVRWRILLVLPVVSVPQLLLALVSPTTSSSSWASPSD